MKASASNRSELAAFRRLLRDVANPAKLVLNPLAARISCASAEDLAASIKWALDVSLCRLAPRLRSIAVRYDVNREPQSSVCKDMGLSRRQFYRDHRAALTQLAALMLAPSGDAGTRSFTPAPAAIRGDRNVKTQRVASDSIVRSLSTGLRNLGQFTESIELLERDFHAHGGDTEGQLEATLEIAEIAIEAGRSSDVAIQLERLRGLTDGSILHRRADLAARHAIFLGHLEPSHG
ncbi:MAG TPA: hypothetical protein VK760_07820, partial [Candidatus Acidoferrales bacterium]|nr:hypothetical protein [Candidatus Acidoferrales bacterium]